MTTLIGIASNLRAVLATHIPFQFVDRRCLRSTDNIEGNCLVSVAAMAPNLKVAVAGVQGVAKRRGRLRRPLEGEHALVPSLAGQPVRLLARVPSALSSRANGRPTDGLSRFSTHVGDHQSAADAGAQILNP